MREEVHLSTVSAGDTRAVEIFVSSSNYFPMANIGAGPGERIHHLSHVIRGSREHTNNF